MKQNAGGGHELKRAAARWIFPLLALFLGSCGGAPPELGAIEWRLELRPLEKAASRADSDGKDTVEGASSLAFYESLAVFANIRDEDGIEDVESMEVLAEDEGLSWRLDDTHWNRRLENGADWLGAADLAMADRSILPRGEYRVIVSDLAGRKAERNFSIPDIKAPLPLPSLEPDRGARGSAFVIASEWPETLLLAYDGAGVLLRAAQVRPGRIELEAALGRTDAAKAASIAVYGYDAARRLGAFSWKTILR